jgi:putative phage-type endonuclease
MTEETAQYAVQRTPEWFAKRLGLVTASRIADVMAKVKTGTAASRSGYMTQLVTERLTGQPTEGYQSAAMEWGIEQEGAARAAYEARTGVLVDEVDFVRHPILEAGASPDGLVGEDGCIEIKCPNTSTMLEYIEDRSVPRKYLLQIQWQLACTGRNWCDFVAYDPRLPEHLQLLVIRVPRDEDVIEQIAAEVGRFVTELRDRVEHLRELRL